MQIDHLDHLVLTVQDIQTTCEFYSRVLGMQVVTFAEGRKALQFGNQKINLHQKGKEFDPKAQYPPPGSASILTLCNHPFEGSIREGMIFHHDRQPFLFWVQRWAFGHCPTFQDTIEFQPKIVMKTGS